jgi:serine/threonine protein kinase
MNSKPDSVPDFDAILDDPSDEGDRSLHYSSGAAPRASGLPSGDLVRLLNSLRTEIVAGEARDNELIASRAVRGYTIFEEVLACTSAASDRTSGQLLEPVVPDRIPEQLGEYKILEKIGSGQFAHVLLAEDQTSLIEKWVAIKLPVHERADTAWIERLRYEAKIWRMLSEHGHPNIVRFENLKCADSHIFIVMEYMDGGDLTAACRRMSEAERIPAAVHVFEQVCRGLAFAHGLEVVHGDIKPQNVLVSRDLDQVKISDFGLAFADTDASEVKTLKLRGKGSILFLAPEVLRGEKGYYSDIYSLGLTVLFLIGGDSLVAEYFERASTDGCCPDITSLFQRRRLDTPNWLGETLERCLAPKPEDRFSDAMRLLDRIETYTDPSHENCIVLNASYNPESQTVGYEIEYKGERTAELLTHVVTREMIAGIFEQWEELGRLALERAAGEANHLDVTGLGQKIDFLLEKTLDDATHFVLGPEVRSRLEKLERGTMRLLYEPRLASIPWELLLLGNASLCRQFALARHPRLLHSVTFPRLNAEKGKIKVLLIGDPGGDLPGAQTECQQLESQFRCAPGADRFEVERLDSMTDVFAAKREMLKCHILHYAGHAIFSERHGDLSRSAWSLKPDLGDLLRADEVEGFWTDRAPMLVFANACVSARTTPGVLMQEPYNDAALGLAQAFLRAGVGSYVGTVWNSPDNAATSEFAASFYRELLAGQTVSQSILTARNHCIAQHGAADLTWARYVLYGDPLIHLPFNYPRSDGKRP